MSTMTHDPLFDEVRAMFVHFQGPVEPRVQHRRACGRRRLFFLIGIAVVLVGGSVASAGQVASLFSGGEPVSQQVKDRIAAGSEGAPPDLDPGIEANKTVTMITIATAKGTVSLTASPARRATYCIGLLFSWGGGVGPGCNGPRDPNTPYPVVDVGQAIPGYVGTSPIYVYGRINDARATTARLELSDGSHRDLDLTTGYFLAELGPTEQLAQVDALDAHGSTITSQDVRPIPHHI
jgi:hypothetical protein